VEPSQCIEKEVANLLGWMLYGLGILVVVLRSRWEIRRLTAQRLGAVVLLVVGLLESRRRAARPSQDSAVDVDRLSPRNLGEYSLVIGADLGFVTDNRSASLIRNADDGDCADVAELQNADADRRRECRPMAQNHSAPFELFDAGSQLARRDDVPPALDF
jgi:hypothetical protein